MPRPAKSRISSWMNSSHALTQWPQRMHALGLGSVSSLWKRDPVTPHFFAISWTTGTLGHRPRYISERILRCLRTASERVCTVRLQRTG